MKGAYRATWTRDHGFGGVSGGGGFYPKPDTPSYETSWALGSNKEVGQDRSLRS